MPERGAQWHAQHVGQGQAGEHHGNRLGPFVGGHQAGGNHRADAEERAVAERRDHARGHQRGVVRCQCAEHVAEDEHQRHAQQRGFARHVGGADGEDRRTEHHAQGVAGDQQSGVRECSTREVAGDIGQQAHDDEFSGADAERRQQRGQAKRVACARSLSVVLTL